MSPFEMKIVEYANKLQAKALKGKKKRGRPAISRDKQIIIVRLRSRTDLTIQQIAEYCAVSVSTASRYADRCANLRRTKGSLTVDRKGGQLIAKSPVRMAVAV